MSEIREEKDKGTQERDALGALLESQRRQEALARRDDGRPMLVFFKNCHLAIAAFDQCIQFFFRYPAKYRHPSNTA